MQSHICKVYACLAVTCHLPFWQNDQDRLRATAVTRGWNGYRNRSQHRKLTLERKKIPAAPAEIRTHDLSVTSPALGSPLNYLRPMSGTRTSQSEVSGFGYFAKTSHDDDVGLNVLRCRADILGTNCKTSHNRTCVCYL